MANFEVDLSNLKQLGPIVIVVADASPIISLSAIGRFDLLRRLYGEVRVPTAVFEEVASTEEDRPGSVEVNDAAIQGASLSLSAWPIPASWGHKRAATHDGGNTMKMKRLFVVAVMFCLTSFGAMLVTLEGQPAGNCTTCDTNDNCITVNIGWNACGSVQINRKKDCNVSGGTCGLP